MKAIVHDRYGPPEVLRIVEVERPRPKDDEVLVRVRATTVTRGDCHHRAGKPLISRIAMPLLGTGGVLKPHPAQILGSEFAGEVVEIGAAVTEFAVGDEVFGVNPGRFGTWAEFVCVRAARMIAPKPKRLTFEEAASVTDGMILALNCMRPAQPVKGKRMLIYGASGSIGTAGVQLARYFEADITAVCNTRNLALVASLGADRVIDYTVEDFRMNGQTYDVVFDAVGKQSFWRCRNSLAPGGVYLPTDGLLNFGWGLFHKRAGNRKVKFTIPPVYKKEDLMLLKELIEAGKYRSVVDRMYPLEDVIEATRYVETQQKTGNVVLTVSANS